MPISAARPMFIPLGLLNIRNRVNRKIATETTAFESVSLYLQGQSEKIGSAS